MKIPLSEKSSTTEIRARFDRDVERFANLETGQSATIDAPLAMELITQAALAATSPVGRVLDIGCGAGNNTLKLLQGCPDGEVACDLNDLSQPMLDRAKERVGKVTRGAVAIIPGDFRTVELPAESYDIIIAAAVLHHLRDETDWEEAFAKVFRLLKPGGSCWITDLVSHENDAIQALMWHRYGAYLEEVGSAEFREHVWAYIDKEDSPRPVTYQLDLMRRVGFERVDLLHKNSCFAAFGGIKGTPSL